MQKKVLTIFQFALVIKNLLPTTSKGCENISKKRELSHKWHIMYICEEVDEASKSHTREQIFITTLLT